MKCKQKTMTSNLENVKSTNNRVRVKGTCAICHSKKSQFITVKTGSGFLNNVIGKLGDLGVELHLASEKGENVSNGSFNNQNNYSYCGPGTKYKQRVQEGYQGINELDSMCKLHDQFYNEHAYTKTRNISDNALAHRADEIARNPIYDEQQRKDANFIAGIMKNKARFGLGMKTKNSKN